MKILRARLLERREEERAEEHVGTEGRARRRRVG